MDANTSSQQIPRRIFRYAAVENSKKNMDSAVTRRQLNNLPMGKQTDKKRFYKTPTIFYLQTVRWYNNLNYEKDT